MSGALAADRHELGLIFRCNFLHFIDVLLTLFVREM